VYVAANVSGGHINPAVTVATLVTGHISFSRGLAYIVAQCLGATVGSALHVRPLLSGELSYARVHVEGCHTHLRALTLSLPACSACRTCSCSWCPAPSAWEALRHT
jgi:glycerol uptake facilitator-like aquaporin